MESTHKLVDIVVGGFTETGYPVPKDLTPLDTAAAEGWIAVGVVRTYGSMRGSACYASVLMRRETHPHETP